MSAEFISFASGIITLRVSGKLTHDELVAGQKTVADIILKEGRVRILVLLEGFHGWEKEGDWGDLTFMYGYDQFMKRMAMVGDEPWRDLATIFAGKGFRQCLVEYFLPEDLSKARAWLLENS